MGMITLKNASPQEATFLPNIFIDDYMPEANGEFVKVYIYLLRTMASSPVSFSLEEMADRLLCTERDILRGLKYWARQGLLALELTDSPGTGFRHRTPSRAEDCRRGDSRSFRQDRRTAERRFCGGSDSLKGQRTEAERGDRPASVYCRTVSG